MRARNLKHLITIEEPTTLANSLGEKIEDSFEEFKKVRTSIESFGTKETFFSNKIVEVSTKKFRMRFIPGVTLDMRIKFNEKYYDIKEIVNPFEENKELIIAAKEVL